MIDRLIKLKKESWDKHATLENLMSVINRIEITDDRHEDKMLKQLKRKMCNLQDYYNARYQVCQTMIENVKEQTNACK